MIDTPGPVPDKPAAAAFKASSSFSVRVAVAVARNEESSRAYDSVAPVLGCLDAAGCEGDVGASAREMAPVCVVSNNGLNLGVGFIPRA